MIRRYRVAVPAILLFLAASAASAAYSPSTTNGWFTVVGRRPRVLELSRRDTGQGS